MKDNSYMQLDNEEIEFLVLIIDHFLNHTSFIDRNDKKTIDFIKKLLSKLDVDCKELGL
jgi:hypothetical protein